MLSIKRIFAYFLLIILLTLATWSVGEDVLSFQSVLRLMNPLIGLDTGINFPLFVLHMGIIFLFIKEISESVDGFFSLEQYILIKKGVGFFIVKCLKYAWKTILLLWVIMLAADLIFSVKDMRESGGALLILNGSIILTLLLWTGAWILLRLLRFSSRSVMLGLVLLICVSTYFSRSVTGAIFTLCPAGLFIDPISAAAGKIGMLLLLTLGICLVSRKYESIGGRE